MRTNTSVVVLAAFSLLGACAGPSSGGPVATVLAEHTATRDGQRIAVRERRLPGVAGVRRVSTPPVVLVHGATWSGRPDFDLRFEDLSTMDRLAATGRRVFTVDVQGYGDSDDPVGDNWSDTASAALDLEAAVELIREVSGSAKVDLVGWSWGAQIAGAFTMAHSDRVHRLVLYGFTWGEGRAPRPAPTEKFRTNSAKSAASDFIPGCFDPEVVSAFVAECLRVDPASPNGVLVDFMQNLPLVDPTRVTVPTLLIFGEHEFVDAKRDDATGFFSRLAHADRQLTIVPDGGHAVHLEHGRHAWHAAVLAFLDR